MARIVVVQQRGELLPIEVWRALSEAPVFAMPDDAFADRLRDGGIDVVAVTADAPPLQDEQPLRKRNLLSQHHHGEVDARAKATADLLAMEAIARGVVTFITDDEQVVRAIVARGMAGDVEIEFVMAPMPRGTTLLELVAVMARLRGPGGCPWDAEQTHQTLAKHLLDETYELLDAIEGGTEADIAEELGDLLLQVVFHAQMGADARAFDIDAVARGLIDKLVRRHPHVFGDTTVSGAAEVVHNWDQIKREEKPERESVFDGVPESLPGLMYAQKVQRRAAAAGFDWRTARGALDKVAEEARELAAAPDAEAREREFGDLLFSLVALGRSLDVDAETALRRAAKRFRDRLVHVEQVVRDRGASMSDMSDDELIALWEQAKAR